MPAMSRFTPRSAWDLTPGVVPSCPLGAAMSHAGRLSLSRNSPVRLLGVAIATMVHLDEPLEGPHASPNPEPHRHVGRDVRAPRVVSPVARASQPRVAWDDLRAIPAGPRPLHGSTLWGPAYFPGRRRGRREPRCRGLPSHVSCRSAEPLWRSDLPGAGSTVSGRRRRRVVVAVDGERLSPVFPADSAPTAGSARANLDREGETPGPERSTTARPRALSQRRPRRPDGLPALVDRPVTPTSRGPRTLSCLLVDIVIANDVAYFVDAYRLYGLSLRSLQRGVRARLRARRGDNPSPPRSSYGRIVLSR